MSHLYQDLQARGVIKQVTSPDLQSILDGETKLTLYCGFDPTSDSLHLGHLLPILMLKRFQEAGHHVIAVVGGATGMIGDPSGKSNERSLLNEEVLQYNVRGLRQTLQKFLNFDGQNAAQLLNNGDWFNGLSYVDFLRDIGKHFTINHMMAKESVRARLEDREHGISYTEFSYMLLQAYDFYHLFKKQGCSLQIGGSDQWGNITAGTELIRRMEFLEQSSSEEKSGEEPVAYGITFPLVTKSDGSKFGKSESGAVWLDASKTSAYDFYQFLIQTADADVIGLLKFFSFKPMSEISRLEDSLKSAPQNREAQIALAVELTELVHGTEALAKVRQATEALFSTSINELDLETLKSVFASAPKKIQAHSRLEQSYSLIDALVDTGLCASKGAARKDVQGGGIYINNHRAADAALVLSTKDLIAGRYLLLRKGKKTYHLIEFQDAN